MLTTLYFLQHCVLFPVFAKLQKQILKTEHYECLGYIAIPRASETQLLHSKRTKKFLQPGKHNKIVLINNYKRSNYTFFGASKQSLLFFEKKQKLNFCCSKIDKITKQIRSRNHLIVLLLITKLLSKTFF